MNDDVYKKESKRGVNFPLYCYSFIKKINESLIRNEVVEKEGCIGISLKSKSFPYDYDALELITRTFKNKGFDTKIPSYHMERENGEKVHVYRWEMSYSKDDFPF